MSFGKQNVKIFNDFFCRRVIYLIISIFLSTNNRTKYKYTLRRQIIQTKDITKDIKVTTKRKVNVMYMKSLYVT